LTELSAGVWSPALTQNPILGGLRDSEAILKQYGVTALWIVDLVGLAGEGYRYKKKGRTTGPAFSHMRLRTGASTVLE
jgi:hypothetical protein